MTKYYNLNEVYSRFEISYDSITWLMLAFFSILFGCLIYKRTKEQFIDLLKAIQFSLVWMMAIRFHTIFILRLTTEVEDHKYYVFWIQELLNWRMVYTWMIQFSWFLLAKHLTLYRKMDAQNEYEKLRQLLRKVEIKYVLFILFGNVLINLISLTIDFVSNGSYSQLMSIINDSIVLSWNLALATNELVMYRKIMHTMKDWLYFYYGDFKKNLL